MLNGRNREPDRRHGEAATVLPGVVASPGFAQGRAVVYAPADLGFEPRLLPEDELEREVSRLDDALRRAVAELEGLKEKARDELGDEGAHIFRSQQTMLEDDATSTEMREMIRSRRCRAESAVQDVYGTYIEMFSSLGEDDYNRERKADLEDVRNRVLRTLLGVQDRSLADIPADSIVVALDLNPSDTMAMDRRRVQGMITERGGITSHVAILARNLGIPAAVGVARAVSDIDDGDALCLDCTGMGPAGAAGPGSRAGTDTAEIHRNPDADTVTRLHAQRDRYQERRRTLARDKHLPPVTADGRGIDVSANIGSVEEIGPARDEGARSIGLFRSEFLFIHHGGNVSEETQFAAYRDAVEAFRDGYVVLRTLDIGADKPVKEISLPAEENPFLGYRGVRISLDRQDLLKTQLRAALRASVHGVLKIMFPMISGPGEVRQVFQVRDAVMDELTREGVPFSDSVEFGLMIEVPSAVLMAEELSRMVDFFSIGTNDLTQYLLAADRMNEKITSYYQPYHPAVFRAIRTVVDAAHRNGKWVGICGELGGMALAIPILAGLGVDEISMSPGSIPEAIHIIRRISTGEARGLAERVLEADHEGDVREIAHTFLETIRGNEQRSKRWE